MLSIVGLTIPKVFCGDEKKVNPLLIKNESQFVLAHSESVF